MATLDKLARNQSRLPEPGRTLTNARSLEALDRLRDAETEYRALSNYYICMEARTRDALLLGRLGEPLVARKFFEQVVKASKAGGVVLSPEDWVKVAQRNLKPTP